MAGARPRTLALAVAAALAVVACSADPSTGTGATTTRPTAGSTAGSPSPTSSAPRTALRVGRPAWVRVSVATLWRSPDSPRPVDAPALAAPARIGQWLSAMTLAERRGLNGRADTQSLLGDRVRVVALRPGWARVTVPDQPTPQDARGYPGWVPRRQLTGTPPLRTDQQVTVVGRTPWLRTDDAAGAPVLRVSFGTRLPYLGTEDGLVRVALPGGGTQRLLEGAVVVHPTGTPALAPTRRGLVRTAREFVGLDYLWAGRSGFGFDCSGLTSLDYRVHGLVLPRDAAPQSTAGRPVAGGLRRGDLLFYATDGVVHHVSMYAGDGLMVHSPGTGQAVEVIPTATPAYQREFAGARRYLRP